MNALVVGYGKMGKLHAKVLRDLGHDVWTLDPDPRMGAHYQRAPAQRFKSFDIVCVATPISAVAEEAHAWIGQTDYLLIEKPMAANLRQARDLADALTGQHVAVGYVERFNPVARAMRKSTHWIRDQHVLFERWNARASRNPRVDLTTHDADLSRFLGAQVSTFDTRAPALRLVRRITATTATGKETFDLTMHTTSPLHHQWRAFLSHINENDLARPADAVAALEIVESLPGATLCSCDGDACVQG